MISRRSVLLAGVSTVIAIEVTAAVQLAEVENVVLGPGPTRVSLLPTAGMDLAARLANARQRRFTLVLRGLAADPQPGAVYLLFLNLPEGIEPSPSDPGYIGTLNFFGMPKNATGANPRALSYEISEALGRLQSAKRLGGSLLVTIVPGRPPVTDSRPVVKNISLFQD